eukprot:5164542-Heterocapsa_arctica.AAC.1
MFEQPLNNVKTPPEDRSNTVNNRQNLQTNARRPFNNMYKPSTTFKALCVCALTGRAEYNQYVSNT